MWDAITQLELLQQQCREGCAECDGNDQGILNGSNGIELWSCTAANAGLSEGGV